MAVKCVGTATRFPRVTRVRLLMNWNLKISAFGRGNLAGTCDPKQTGREIDWSRKFALIAWRRLWRS